MEEMETVREAGQSPGTTIFRLNGPFTLNTMFAFQSELREPGLSNVIVDLTGVPYMDSAGLGVLLGQYAHCERAGFRLALCGISPRLRTIFEITHTDDLLNFLPTVEEADASFGKV